MVVVCIWNSGVTIGDNRLRGGEFFRMITDRARELLTSIKEGVMQGQAARGTSGSPSRKQGDFNPKGTQNYDMLNVSRYEGAPAQAAKLLDGGAGGGPISTDKIDEQILSLFKRQLKQEDTDAAQAEIAESLNCLTKAAILELKTMSKPNPLVEKTLQIVVALKGFKHVNWNTAKEMIGKPSFKVDLMQMTPKTMRPADVLTAQKILT